MQLPYTRRGNDRVVARGGGQRGTDLGEVGREHSEHPVGEEPVHVIGDLLLLGTHPQPIRGPGVFTTERENLRPSRLRTGSAGGIELREGHGEPLPRLRQPPGQDGRQRARRSQRLDMGGRVRVADTPWTLIGPVLPGEHPAAVPTVSPGTYPRWSATAVYVAGDRVQLEGVAYQTKWWTQGDVPGKGTGNAFDYPWALVTAH